MSNPRDLIRPYEASSEHPYLGTVVGDGGMVRVYPANEYAFSAHKGTVCISATNSDKNSAGGPWEGTQRVRLNKEQALAFIHAIAEAVRNME
jgi:hypothetical protein